MLTINSNIPQKRSRPLLGTFFSVTFEAAQAHLITLALEEAARLEALFSLFDPNSPLSQFNRDSQKTELPLEVQQLMSHARDLYKESNGAFDPYLTSEKIASSPLDLNGIAKGYIVDQVSQFLLSLDPSFLGVVEAGGDLRFLNKADPLLQIRCGAFEKPRLQSVKTKKPAVAVSSLSVSLECSLSTSKYAKPLARGLKPRHTVATSAQECWLADAFTKVVLFTEDQAELEDCAQRLKVDFLILDEHGALIDSWESS